MESLLNKRVDGPPYASTTAGIGGLPSTTVDDPITAVFLLLFVIGAAAHMTIFQMNKRAGHKFLASGALFGFNMSRIVTCTMRLVWSTHQTSVQVALAANIFVNAGVVLLIVINLLFAQRILRAAHPTIGWSRTIHFAYLAYFISIPANLIMLITSIVYQVYTLDPSTLAKLHIIQLVGGTYNVAAAFAPLPIVLLAVLIPLRDKRRVEKFGSGRYRTKVAIILASSFLICLGAAFRGGVAYVPRPIADPAWYHSKACFYIFNFTVEIIVVYMYALVRVDRRFHVPNGSSAPGHYAGGLESGKGSIESEPRQRFTSDEEFLDEGPETVEDDKPVEEGKA